MIEFLFNGFILVIPVLVWNLVFYRTLPLWHQIKIGNNLEKVDSLLRIPIFGLPLVFRFSVFTDIHQIGWVIYGIGIILYFASWIITISGNVNKNQSVLTALGPAYTPILWLIGIGMACWESGWRLYLLLLYFLSSIVFVIVHTMHTLEKYKRRRY